MYYSLTVKIVIFQIHRNSTNTYHTYVIINNHFKVMKNNLFTTCTNTDFNCDSYLNNLPKTMKTVNR